MKDALTIIWEHFDEENLLSSPLQDLLNYLDIDTIVDWFVSNGYIEELYDDEDIEIVQEHYDLHCN